MKKLTTTIAAIAAITTAAQADLSPKQFDKVINWARNQGYTYDGGATRSGIECFVFSNHDTSIVGLIPISSDTADEAINALIASTITFQETIKAAKQEIQYNERDFIDKAIELKVNGIIYALYITSPNTLKDSYALKNICNYAFSNPNFADRAYEILVSELNKDGWL